MPFNKLPWSYELENDDNDKGSTPEEEKCDADCRREIRMLECEKHRDHNVARECRRAIRLQACEIYNENVEESYNREIVVNLDKRKRASWYEGDITTLFPTPTRTEPQNCSSHAPKTNLVEQNRVLAEQIKVSKF